MSALVVPLEEAVNVAEHGGKAVGLARLMRAGLPVPAGIAIADGALRRWPEHATRVVADAFRLAQGRPLAVRSSAAGEDGRLDSFAGLLDSVLGVDPAKDLEQALARVRASRDSARALAYEKHRGSRLAGMGVILQRQVDARFSGVLFTRSPEAGRAHDMLCEYGEGTGERLVAGSITPGRVRISRASLELGWESEGEAGQRPPAEWIERLARSAQAAERLFGMPQDIEWAFDHGGALWLLQSRPITTGEAPALRRVLWSNANVNENFPEPLSPLLYSVAAAGYTSYFRGLGRAFGVPTRRLQAMEADLRTIIGVQAGRMYYNLTSIHAVLRAVPGGALLARWFDDFVGASGPQAARGARPDVRQVLELAWMLAKTIWQYLFLGRRLRVFEDAVDRYAARTTPQRLVEKTGLELRDDLRGFLEIRLHGWTGAALCDAAAMACYGALKALLPQPDVYLKGLDGLASAEPVGALWDLSRRIRADRALRELFAQCPAEEVVRRLQAEPRFDGFNAALSGYLERWGFRFSGELMLTAPSFQERPHELVAILAHYAAQDGEPPASRLARQKCERLSHTRRWLPALPLIAATQRAIGYRERARLKQALLYSRLRRVALEIGAHLVRQKRLAERDDVFFLSAQELDELLSGTAMFPHAAVELVALRMRKHAEFAALQPDDVMSAPEGEYPRWEAAARPGNATAQGLQGTSACGGVVTGRARVLTDVTQACALEPGDILVTRQTDPGWAPAFVAIGGLVLERGGMLSHGAILAREYGIPTVVGIAGATACIPDGAQVRIDGDRGAVEILR